MEEHDNSKQLSYPAAEVLLSVIQQQYDRESERGVNLQSRAGVILTFAIALLTFLTSTSKLPSIKTTAVQNVSQAFPHVILIICFVFCIISIIVAIFFLIKVVAISTYKRVPTTGFTEISGQELKEKMTMGLTILYKGIVEFNTEVTNKKVYAFKIGLYAILVALVLNAISFFISVFYLI